jgi:hypothetical protein
MGIDLAVDSEINGNVQTVKDQSGNESALSISNQNVAICNGSVQPKRKFEVFGDNTVDGAIAASNSDGTKRIHMWVDDTNNQGRIDFRKNGEGSLRINDGGGLVSMGGGLTVHGKLKIGHHTKIHGDLIVQGETIEFSGLNNLPGSGSTVDLVVDSNGNVSTQTSSTRFKEKICQLKDDFQKVLSIDPISFTYSATGEPGIGYSAEQLDEKKLNKLVAYDSEGKPLSVHYKMISVYLLEIIKKQQATLEEMGRQIDDVQNKLAFIETGTA